MRVSRVQAFSAEISLWPAQKAIERIVQASGVKFRGHDLRRTAASLMVGAGVPRLVVSKILNHVETGVTAVYDRHSYDLEKRAARFLGQAFGSDHQRQAKPSSGIRPPRLRPSFSASLYLPNYAYLPILGKSHE